MTDKPVFAECVIAVSGVDDRGALLMQILDEQPAPEHPDDSIVEMEFREADMGHYLVDGGLDIKTDLKGAEPGVYWVKLKMEFIPPDALYVETLDHKKLEVVGLEVQ